MNNSQSSISIDSWAVAFRNSSRTAKCAKLSQCGDYVVTIDDVDEVQVLRLSTGDCWRVPVKGRAQSLAVSIADEFAVVSASGNVQRFDLTLPTMCIGSLPVSGVSSIAYDPAGTTLAVAQINGKLSVFDLHACPNPALIGLFRVSDRSIPIVCARRNSVLGVDRSGRLFYLHDAEAQSQIVWNGGDYLDVDCYTMAVHPLFTRIVVGGSGGYMRLYSTHNAVPVHLVTSFRFIRDLVFLADFNLIAVVGDCGLEVWNLETKRVELSWKSSRGKVLAVRSVENRLRVLYG
jgi:WD40 repeat protein